MTWSGPAVFTSDIGNRLAAGALVAAFLLAPSSVFAQATAPGGESARLRLDRRACIRTTIETLAADPGRYEGRRICVSGFFGRIEPYGETRFSLFATRAEAEARRADFFLDLGIRWDVMLQVRLSRRSAYVAGVDGIFEHSRHCWPGPGQSQSDYNCSPTYPMRVHYLLLRFSDGTEHRHPEFDARMAHEAQP